MNVGGRARRVAFAFVLVTCLPSPGAAQSFLAGTARNASGVLVVVRSDGVETRLRGRGALQIFEGDVLRMHGAGALIEMDEGIQVALNGTAVARILARWDKTSGVTRIVRVQRGEVWARSRDAQRALELETPVGVLALRSAEVSVRVNPDQEAVATVVTGTADFATPFSTCRLTAGTRSFASRGKACTSPSAADTGPVIGWSQPLLRP
jgi:hypothetical protein